MAGSGNDKPLNDRPLNEKPVVGTSACLLGEAVRYDGAHKHTRAVADELARHVRLCAFCPELGIGLSVPRPPIQLVRFPDAVRVRGVEEPERDFTDALRAYADAVEAGLSGFVFKARSPSCGLESTPVFDEEDREVDTASGAFAARLRELFPEMPVCDEEELEVPGFLEEFVARVRAFHRQC